MAVHNESSFVLAYFHWGACKRRGQSKCIKELCLGQDDRFLPSYSVSCFCWRFVYSLSNWSAVGWDLGTVAEDPLWS